MEQQVTFAMAGKYGEIRVVKAENQAGQHDLNQFYELLIKHLLGREVDSLRK